MTVAPMALAICSAKMETPPVYGIAPSWPMEYGGPGLDNCAALHSRTGDLARRHAAAAGLRRHHGRAGDLYFRQ